MKITAIIPARYSSNRLPGKPLLEIAGKSMIRHVVERVDLAEDIDEVLVATDDERIADEVRSFGGRAVLTSPEHPSGTDRIAEVAAGMDFEVAVNVQGDEPLVRPSMIADLVAPFHTLPDLEMATLATRLREPADFRDPSKVKVVRDLDGYALYFSRAPVPFDRDAVLSGREEPSTLVLKHIGMYAFTRDYLLEFAETEPTPLEKIERLEQLRALETGHRIWVALTPHDTVGVDTMDDLERVRRIVEGREPERT